MEQYNNVTKPAFSKGWLEGFMKRYDIKQYSQSGEPGSVDIEAAESRIVALLLLFWPKIRRGRL